MNHEHEQQDDTMLLEGSMLQEAPTDDTETIHIDHTAKLSFSGLGPDISQNINIHQLFAYFGLDPAHHSGSGIQGVSSIESTLTMQSGERYGG
ncbi:unnamed protein product [Urochloa humidicola]